MFNVCVPVHTIVISSAYAKMCVFCMSKEFNNVLIKIIQGKGDCLEDILLTEILFSFEQNKDFI